MNRKFAGILGPVAFATTLLHGWIVGASVESNLQLACFCLFGFAAIGWIVGSIAEWVVIESVQGQFNNELKAQMTRRAADTAEASQVEVVR